MTEQQALSQFAEGFDCSQVVFASAAEKMGMPREEALRLAAVFGGGMYAGETCGAVVGALMALGWRYGHSKANDPDTKNKALALASAFRASFCEQHGSTMCKEILGHNIGVPEELQLILDKKLLEEVCPKVTVTAANLVAQML